jgi:hypothetical protein
MTAIFAMLATTMLAANFSSWRLAADGWRL